MQGAIGAAAQAEIETQQVRAQFGLDHPGLLAGMTATPLLVAALPEVLLGGFALDASEVALEAGEVAEESSAIARGGVYALRDVEGIVMRTGRTGDLARRAAEHARDPLLKDFVFDPIYRTDVYAEQRGLEQVLHDTHSPIYNRINPIDPANPKFDEVMNAARELSESDRTMKALPYREGDVFAIPLRSGGFSLGVVARSPKQGGVLLGYFFGNRSPSVPRTSELPALLPENALKVVKFGDLSLMSGEWPVVGHIRNWDRDDWPMPKFIRRDPIGKRARLVSYADDDPNRLTAEEPVDFEDTRYEQDFLFGAGAVELVLTRLLASVPPDQPSK